jgi:transcriptional regulator with XRE-family HTH domain
VSESQRRELALTIAENLRALRARRRLTQRQVCDQVGCSLSYLQALESGSHMGAPTNPTLDLLADLAAAYGVTVIDLLTSGGRGHPSAPSP